ncbi:MAG: NAD-dependent epimerase/dehydratase family protein [Actinobacteria bacterium]|nr:NAD-dependent epimerase/dehydratase family protein [Actinomycetota bacterium]
MSDLWGSRSVVLTGGAGFLGSVVRRKLEERGSARITVPRRSDHDLTQRDQVEKLFAEADPDMVIHLAARVGGIGANLERPAELYLANLLMGTHIIEEARIREVDKTVLVGTICSYPKFTPVPFKEGDLWNGYPEETNAPYGLAKKAILVHAQSNHAQYGQRFTYVLPTNLYGPGDKFNASVSHVIPALIKKFVEAKESDASTVEVWGTGNATREFLYVEDAAEGLLLAAEKVDAPEPINLGTGEEIRIADLARLIAELVGFGGDLTFDTSKPDGQPRRAVDTSRAQAALGFEAITPLRAGLRTTIDWYTAHREEAEAATL